MRAGVLGVGSRFPTNPEDEKPLRGTAAAPAAEPDFREPLAAAPPVPGPDRGQAIYVWLFWQELYYLLMATFGNAKR